MLKLARKKLGNQNAYFEANPYTIFLDGELKLVTMLCSYKKNKPVYTSVIFDYDFEKKSVKSTELYNGWIPKKIETVISISEIISKMTANIASEFSYSFDRHAMNLVPHAVHFCGIQ